MRNFVKNAARVLVVAAGMGSALGTASAQEDETLVQCGASQPERDEPLRLSFLELPEADSETSSTRGSLKLLVHNTSSETVFVDLTMSVSTDGKDRTLPPATLTLGRGARAIVPISLAELSLPLSSLKTSGQLRVSARTGDGKSSRASLQTFAPDVFFHGHEKKVVSYRAGALDARYAGGAGEQKLAVLRETNEPLLSFQSVVMTGSEERAAWVPERDAAAPERFVSAGQTRARALSLDDFGVGRQLCMRLRTQLTDADYGDYLKDELIPAIGVRYVLNVPFVGRYEGRTSKTTGCITLPAAAASAPSFYVTMYFESRVGYGNHRNLIVRSFSDYEVNGVMPWSYETFQAAGGGEADVPRNSFYVQPGPGTSTIVLSTHPNNAMMAGMLAVAAHGVQRLENLAKPQAAASQNLNLIPRDCEGYPPGTSCAGSQNLSISAMGGDYRRKFLIGHEVGHWYQNLWTSGFPDMSYAVSGPAQCSSVDIHGAHALRSMEYASGALVEGFAHFLSTLMLNEPGWGSTEFKYYKQFDALGYNYDLVNVAADLSSPMPVAGGPIDVLHNVCGGNVAARGVELDWLRHYWHYFADSGSKPSLSDILNQMDAATPAMDATTGSAFEELRDVMAPGALRDRWDALGVDYGADDGA